MKAPELPAELYPYDYRNIDDVLHCLSWQVGSYLRAGLFQGYEDIDLAYLAFLLSCGLTDEQIYVAFGLVFLTDYDNRRTEQLISRTREKIAKGEDIRGAGSFVQKVRELAEDGRKVLEKFIYELQNLIRNKPDDHKRDKFTVLTKFYARPFTDEILKEHRFVYEGERGDFYYYDEHKGLWINNAQDYITHYFRKLTDKIDDTLKKKYVISEIVADIQGCTWKPEGLPEPAINLIPCKNGVYDLKHDVFMGFQAEDFFTRKIPFNYNPDAKCPFLEKVINSILPTDDIITLWELMAYALYRGYPLHKFFLLLGPGSNGKSTYMTIFIRMLGPENVSNISLTDIQNNRFAASNLYRKLANASGEVAYCDIRDTALLKQLTGGDQIETDRKFKKSIRFVNFAKLIFSTNQVPKTYDNTDAFYRRAFIISFPYKFRIDPSLDIKIREDSEEMTLEYEGLLFKTLEHFKVLMKNNFMFTKDQDIETVRGRYNYLSNPLVQFVVECCEKTYQDNDFIFKYEFSQKLNEWIIARKMNTYSQEKIGREMKDLGHKDARKESPNKEKRYFAWVGLRWKTSNSVKAVKDIKVVDNTLLYTKKVETVVNPPDNPANPDTNEVINVLEVLE